MRYILLTIGAFCLSILSVIAEDTKGVEVVKTSGETLHFANKALKNLTLEGGYVVLTDTANHIVKINRSEIQHIAPVDKVANHYSVSYDGAKAHVVNPYAIHGVSTVIDGAYVTTTNTNENDELAFSLSGITSDGAFTYNGTYKCTLTLDGTDITSQRGAAVNILCGKRIAVNVTSDNTLTDCVGGEQKACLYFKGHPEFTGSGSLLLTGNTNHALSAKEYIQMKKSFGTLHILKAVNDGIHAGQYFQMNGGNVIVENIGGDGVQAEITDDPEDEQNGQLIIKGGTLNVSITAQDVAGLKSDSLLTIMGGDITIKATGAADKGIKSKTDLLMNEGTLTIMNSGAGATIDKESETAKGLSADRNITLQGGIVSIQMTGTGGKGIKADGIYTQGNKETGEGPKLNISTTGASYSETTNNTGWQSGGGGWTGGWPGGGPGGGGRPGGGGVEGGNTGSSSKAIKAMGDAYLYGGESIINTATNGAEGLESKNTIYIEGGKHYFKCYDDCINSRGNIYFNGGITVCYSNGNDAVDSNAGKAGAITIGDGVVLAYTSKGSPEEGLDCDNNSYIRITGNGIAISAGGSQGGGGGFSGSSITNATQGYILSTSSIAYKTGRYYTLADNNGNNLVTYSLDANVNSSLSLITCRGMVKGNTYSIKSDTVKPLDAISEWHGLYLGSSAQGVTSVYSFTAK